MPSKIATALERRKQFIQLFQSHLRDLDQHGTTIEEAIHDLLPDLSVVNPFEAMDVPEPKEITIDLPKKIRRHKPRLIHPAPHDTGLFLLPYTETFRKLFISRFQQALQAIRALLGQLRALEIAFYHEEKAIKNEKEHAESEEKKKEKPPKTNVYLKDYRFFKYLYTHIPDNTILGNMFQEIGEHIVLEKVKMGHIVDSLWAEGAMHGLGQHLRENLSQFHQVMPLCDNMFVSSIASWASLSTYISLRAKALEKDLLDTQGGAFQEAYLSFETALNRWAALFKGAPTSMQKKALFYAQQSLLTFLSKNRHPKDYFKLNNFSQVGTGKTYTTPIFVKMFAELFQEDQRRRGKGITPFVTLFLTEANLCENVVKSMMDMGVSKQSLFNTKLKDLSTIDFKSGDCVVLSRHEVGLKEKAAITQPLEALIRKGFHFILVSDESSFLKNTESGISSAMETLVGYLKKRKALWVDYRLTATPANNDTGDFLYLIGSNLINLASFLHNYPDIAGCMDGIIKQTSTLCKDKISLAQILQLLNVSQSRTGVLIYWNVIEPDVQGAGSKRMYELFYTDCAGAILVLYYLAVYRMGLYPIKPWLGTNGDGKAISPNLIDIMQKLGVSYARILQPIHEASAPFVGLEKALVHSGSRDLDALIPCLPLLKEMTSSFTYDRALNAEDEVHFQINSKQLKPNLLESVTYLEVLEKIRQFLNLTMFVNLIRKVHAVPQAWYAVRESVERECRRLRLEFLATYAHLHGVPLTQKVEVIQRSVHKGFRIVEEREDLPYWAASTDQLQEMIELLETMSEGEILGHRLLEELAQFFAPVRYFELLCLIESEKKSGAQGRTHDEGISKKRALILETLSVALNFDSENRSFAHILRLFKSDLHHVQQEEDDLFHFRPSILFKYPMFLHETIETLTDLSKERLSNTAQKIKEVLSDIGSGNVDLAQTLAEYGIIFKASESVNFPLVLRFADRILHRLSTLLANEGITLEIREGDIDHMRKTISTCASFENYAAQMAAFTKEHQVPLLISCRYRFSQQSLVASTHAAYSVTGETKKSDRYTILEGFDQLGMNMGRTLVATTKSILKGFNLFFTQYGFMSEGIDNAEVRLQMAGRLRPLFPQHVALIERLERHLQDTRPNSPVIQHLGRLKQNVKVFDVVSPQMISGFPDIQNGKAFMLNTLLFSQTHQRSFPELFPDQEVFHFMDTKPIFNARTVEAFCRDAIKTGIQRHKDRLQGQQQLSVLSFISHLNEEIQEVAESNMKLSSYYDFLSA